MIRIMQLKLDCGHTKEELRKKAASALRVNMEDITKIEIIRRSIDARKKPQLFYSYTVDVAVKKEEQVLKTALKRKGCKEQFAKSEGHKYVFPQAGEQKQHLPIAVIGAGPAGLFCAYFLTLHGYAVTLLERGRDVDTRAKDVEAFWETGVLCPNSNVQFGEGGAGTFSDGKLNTLVKDKDGRSRAVLEVLVKFGAPEEILYDAKPHIGTDVLSRVVKGMREEILANGGKVLFESQVTDLRFETDTEKTQKRLVGLEINHSEIIPCDQAVLAIGHSARDTFSMLWEKEIPMEAKAFAVGLRVEHPQEQINISQYGKPFVEGLGAAPYKVTAKTSVGRGVYSFCMCPGGYVVNASSEEGRLAVNGMSYRKRDGKNANSAVIVTVTPKDFGSDHPLAGITFQRELEERAYLLGGGKIPAQRYGDFKKKVLGELSEEKEDGTESTLMPACKGAFKWANVNEILPEECNLAFVEGMTSFARQIHGFDRPDAVLTGVESRTSSPIRIRRGENLQSSFAGLYPCGEGAGYAGGITSAAMDGLRVAEELAKCFSPMENRV